MFIKRVKAGIADFKAMNAALDIPAAYYIYAFVVANVNLVLFLYGMIASEIVGSFTTCLVGWISYCTASWMYSQYLAKTDLFSKKLHSIALVGHVIVTILLVMYLF